LLPLCFYAQPTYLEPDRHKATNNVSVPISASERSLPRLRQPPIGTRGNFRATPQSGVKTQTKSLSPYPSHPMVSHALPRIQWALAGAKRLECGSLLPLCFYAQPTCLEPDRHKATNNVSVPISASERSLPRLRQPPIGTRGNFRATLQSGVKTQTASLSLYPAHHDGRAVVTALLTARKAETEKLSKLAA